MTDSNHITTDTLADHAEGLLGEAEAGRVATHLEGCADCRSTALMLASLSEILAADDPGPMPAQYVARINATLAELAIAEPVIPGQAAPAPTPPAPASSTGGAQVIDLASRRKIMVTGLRRVGTVAAGVVLLITGAALGIQTLGNRSGPGPGSDASKTQPPVVDATITAEVFNIPADAVQNKQGNFVDPSTGTVYIPSSDKKVANKVLLPSGPEIVKSASGNPIVIKPAAPLAVRNSPSPAPTTGGKSGHGHPGPVVAPLNTAPPTSAATPPAAAAPSATPNSAQGQVVGPADRPRGTQPDDGRPRTTAVEPGRSEGDPYVTQSGSVYSEDNFASKVMDLVSDADQHPGPNDNGRQAPAAGQPAPAAAPVTDPAEPAAGPNDVTTSKATTTSKRFGPGRDVTAGYTAPTAAIKPNAHGPASFDVEARVLRCAALTHRPAIAGDAGYWGDQPATIVIVQSPNQNQVMGYVFYGECNQRGPVTAQQSPWEQTVDKPGTQPPGARPSGNQPSATQPATPPKRVGDVTSSQTQVKSSDPATAPPLGANSVTPDQQLS
jgi:hypothetical protein